MGSEPQSLKGADRLGTAKQLPGSVPSLQVRPVLPVPALVPEQVLALQVWRRPPASSALRLLELLLLELLLLALLFSVLPSVPLSWQPASSPLA